jgi:hypothetical protein
VSTLVVAFAGLVLIAFGIGLGILITAALVAGTEQDEQLQAFHRHYRGPCPNCNWIGEPTKCGCQYVIDRVAAGAGLDEATKEQARTIQQIRELREGV